MDDGSKPGSKITSEAASGAINESAKLIAIAAGMDPVTASIVGGAAGGAIKALEPAFKQLAKRRQQRTQIAVNAAQEVGGDLDELLLSAMQDDQKLELLGRALEVAQRTTDHNKVKFYGKIAAEGILATDRALVDEKDKIFTNIAALDPPDLKVLLHMHGYDMWKKKYHKENMRTVANELPELDAVLDAVFAKLENLGLITGASEQGMSFGSQWGLTAFGKLCVEELRRLGGSPDQDEAS